MSEFKIPPISTLAGSSLFSYFRVLGSGKVSPGSYLKVVLTTVVVVLRVPFGWWEWMVFAPKLRRFRFKEPPLFILGHWRSGTTLLHNTLCKDPEASYLSTYGSLFPNNLASAAVFKTFMRMNMPDRRPADRVELNIDFPQEDEFAFGNMQPDAYYNFFYFPQHYPAYYRRAVHQEGLEQRQRERWYRAYDTLLKKAAIAHGGERLIVKNPVNTARIASLLKLYPDARFLHIHRDPVAVFLSTRRFFLELLPTLCLGPLPDTEFVDNMILDVYEWMHRDYQAQKDLIPAGNLLEVRYEELEQDPMGLLERVYGTLLQRDMKAVRPLFEAYLKSQGAHKASGTAGVQAMPKNVQERLARYARPAPAARPLSRGPNKDTSTEPN